MSNFISWLFGGAWTTELVWLHNLSDALIWMAYLAIAFVLVFFATRIRGLPFPWLFLLYGAFIRHEAPYASVPRPDLILLDLNLPCKDGREVLAEIKSDPDLRQMPVVVLTTSSAEQDIIKSYDLQANCYLTKPVQLDDFIAVVRSIESFWLMIVSFPTREGR
jgi:CheY-like chemotaxis protein